MEASGSIRRDFVTSVVDAWRRAKSWELVGSIFIVYLSFTIAKRTIARRRLRLRLGKKRKQLQDARDRLQERVKSDPPSPAIRDLSALEVQDKLRSQGITPFEALRMYQMKVIDVLDCNGICDVIEEAEAVAKSVSPDCHSPIRGLPVSIKENIAIAGYDSTVGLVSRTLEPTKEDSLLVQVLRSAGAVPFVTTTMSPTGLCLDASTEIFGKQRNPHDVHRLVGGSSSGEGILISKDASPLGFGTDIGGSVRIPAAWCGICALKPTSYRVSTLGVTSVSQSGCTGLKPVFGPMARHTRLLADALRAILTPQMFEMDPRMPRIPFREDVFSSKKPLVVGIYTNIGGNIAVRSVPSVECAVARAKTILEERGHKVVEFEIPEPDEAVRLSMTAILADGGYGISRIARNDPTNVRFRRTLFVLGIPAMLRRVVAWFVSHCLSKSIGEIIRTSTGCQTAMEVFNTLEAINGCQEMFAKAWASAKIDVLLCPVLPFPAPLESVPDPLMSSALPYTSFYNLLDYPTGVVPVSKVTESDVGAASCREAEYRQAGDWVNAAHAKWQSGTKGLPVAVQVVGRPLDEETVLRVLSEIEEGCSSE